jgi:ubiquinone/menaquinone biosynthesis C-methylase UbiE
MFLQFFRSLRRQKQMDPLHVTMTGVRMGERFLQVGCDDAALLGGLAGKVGLSGSCAVATFDEESAERARKAGVQAGALMDIRRVATEGWPFDSESMDLVVVDDTRGSFARRPAGDRQTAFAEARRALRPGGRIEVVERRAVTGLLGGAITRPDDYDVEAELSAAGFAPVRMLAEKEGVRFVEGLKGGR